MHSSLSLPGKINISNSLLRAAAGAQGEQVSGRAAAVHVVQQFAAGMTEASPKRSAGTSTARRRTTTRLECGMGVRSAEQSPRLVTRGLSDSLRTSRTEQVKGQ